MWCRSLRRVWLLPALAVVFVAIPLHVSAAPAPFSVFDAIDGTSLGGTIPISVAGGAATATRTVVVQRNRGSKAVTVSKFIAVLDGATAEVSVLGSSGAGAAFRSGQRVFVQISVSGISGNRPRKGALVALIGANQIRVAGVEVAPSPLSDLKIVNATDGGLAVSSDRTPVTMSFQLRNGGATGIQGLVPAGTLVGPDGSSVPVNFDREDVSLAAGATVSVTATADLVDTGAYSGYAQFALPSPSGAADVAPLTTALTVTRTSAPLQATATVVAPGITTDLWGDASATLQIEFTETGGRAHSLTIENLVVTHVDEAGKVIGAATEVSMPEQTIKLTAKGHAVAKIDISKLPGRGQYKVSVDATDENGASLTVDGGQVSVRQHEWVAASLILIGVLANALLAFLSTTLITKAQRRRRLLDYVDRLNRAPDPQTPATQNTLNLLHQEADRLDASLSSTDATDRLTTFDAKTRLVADWIRLDEQAQAAGVQVPDLEAVRMHLAGDDLITDSDRTKLISALDKAEHTLRRHGWLTLTKALRAAALRAGDAAPDGALPNLDGALAAADQAEDVEVAEAKFTAAFAEWQRALATDLKSVADLSPGWRPADKATYRRAVADAAVDADHFMAATPATDPAEMVKVYVTRVSGVADALAHPNEADLEGQPPAVAAELDGARDDVAAGRLRLARDRLTKAAEAYQTPQRIDVRELMFDLLPADVVGTPTSLATGALPSRMWLGSKSRADADRKIRRTIGWARAVIFVIALVVAVLLGLVALYKPNAAWGDGWDMIAAVTWGLALGSAQYAGIGALEKALTGST